MRLIPLLALLLASAAFPGCSEPPQTCSDLDHYNPHEQTCVPGAGAGMAVCYVTIQGRAHPTTMCNVESDGTAWLDFDVVASTPYNIQVRDGAGTMVYEYFVRDGGSAQLRGVAGAWNLYVAFGAATGNGTIVLWG